MPLGMLEQGSHVRDVNMGGPGLARLAQSLWVCAGEKVTQEGWREMRARLEAEMRAERESAHAERCRLYALENEQLEDALLGTGKHSASKQGKHIEVDEEEDADYDGDEEKEDDDEEAEASDEEHEHEEHPTKEKILEVLSLPSPSNAPPSHPYPHFMVNSHSSLLSTHPATSKL